MNLSAAIRQGNDPTSEDMAKLEEALATQKGMKKYLSIIERMEGTADANIRDQLAYYSLYFWKDEMFVIGKNRFASAHQCKTSRTVSLDQSGLLASEYGMQDKNADRTTYLRKKAGRVAEITVAEPCIGNLNNPSLTEDPMDGRYMNDYIRTILNACKRAGLLKEVLVILYFWKIEVPSFTTLNAQENDLWSEVTQASDEVEGNSLKQIAFNFGLGDFKIERTHDRIINELRKARILIRD